jgi:hypothetical protein
MGNNGHVDSNKVPTNSAMTYKVGPSFTTLAPDKLWRNLENFRERVNSCGGLWGMVRINQLKKTGGALACMENG